MLERSCLFFAKLCKVDENPELGMWLLIWDHYYIKCTCVII